MLQLAAGFAMGGHDSCELLHFFSSVEYLKDHFAGFAMVILDSCVLLHLFWCGIPKRSLGCMHINLVQTKQHLMSTCGHYLEKTHINQGQQKISFILRRGDILPVFI